MNALALTLALLLVRHASHVGRCAICDSLLDSLDRFEACAFGGGAA